MPLELNEEQHAASATLAEWWGDFMPIDQPHFKGLEFRRYNMNLETQIKTLDSHFGDLTADSPSRNWLGKSLPSTSGQSSMTESVNEGKAANGPVVDEPSYNLGWNVLPLPSPGNPSTSVDDSTGNDEGPAYALGWAVTVTLGEQEEVGLGDEDMPAYDLRWGVTTEAEQPMWEDTILVSRNEDNGPTYDLGWGVTSAGKQPIQQDIIDVADKGPLYDLGWGKDQGSHLLKMKIYTMVVKPECHSPGKLAAEVDQHVYAIVENAVHGLNDSCVPAQIIMENRHILKGSVEAWNWVNTVRSDMCQLHRLIQLQCWLLKLVDHIIRSLENPEW
ncbi:hypothetical protein DFH29DRAFT_871641 [Suillus ampliporus]|nr:hypothetical protein DFH29DRAFT_871641 [Suillus ampliporus]